MSAALRRSWRVVRARRQEGPEPTRGDLTSTAHTGREWVEREIMGPWRIEEGDLVAINSDVTASTLPNLLALKDQMPLEEVIEAAVAAGFTNGLALGLLHGSQARLRA